MPRSRCRPFTVLDAMVLIAATAVGIAVMRRDALERFEVFAHCFNVPESLGSYWEVFNAFVYNIRGLQPLLMAWSGAFLLLRLRPPRPSGLRLARQPGFAASCGVVLISAIDFLSCMCAYIRFSGMRENGVLSLIEHYLYFLESWLEAHGSAVAATWAVMVLGRTFRPEPSWIDRGGRALGIFWLVLLCL